MVNVLLCRNININLIASKQPEEVVIDYRRSSQMATE